MLIIEYIEVPIVSIFIVLQLLIFINTKKRIKLFRLCIPDSENLTLHKVSFSKEILRSVKSSELVKEPEKYQKILISKSDYEGKLSKLIEEFLGKGIEQDEAKSKAEQILTYSKKDLVEVSLVRSTIKGELIDELLQSLNTYLIRNSGAVADFHLLKDIVERNTDSVDDDINISLPVPLYIGLMCTMIGIVVGLFFMPGIGSDKFLQGDGIDVLISGVKFAMIASFTGLGFTVINSSFIYKGCKSFVERRKNKFYTFLQTELLPVISQNVNANLVALNRGLTNFSTEFRDNLKDLTGLMNKNYETLRVQENILIKLETIDIKELSIFNVKVFEELSDNVKEFQKFNKFINRLNGFLENTATLNDRLNVALSRTENIESITHEIKSILAQSKDLQTFLNSHFSVIEQRGNLIKDAVVIVEDVLLSSLAGLEKHTQEKITDIKNMSVQHEDLLNNAFDSFINSINETTKSQAGLMEGYFEEMRKQVSKGDTITKIEDLISLTNDLIKNSDNKLNDSSLFLKNSVKQMSDDNKRTNIEIVQTLSKELERTKKRTPEKGQIDHVVKANNRTLIPKKAGRNNLVTKFKEFMNSPLFPKSKK